MTIASPSLIVPTKPTGAEGHVLRDLGLSDREKGYISLIFPDRSGDFPTAFAKSSFVVGPSQHVNRYGERSS